MRVKKWKKIEQAPNYEVSNYGEVRNLKTGYILKPIYNYGYAHVCIKDSNNKFGQKRVHRLVAQAFIPNPLNKSYVNHKDFNRSNNYVDNLEWATRSEINLWSREHISKAHMGIKRKLLTRKKVSNYVSTKKNRELPTYIYDIKGYYTFLIRRFEKTIVSKSFKELNKAIEYKDNWIKEHKGEIEHYYD